MSETCLYPAHCPYTHGAKGLCGPCKRRRSTVVAWDRGEAGLCSIHDIANRYSVQHVVLDGGNHALCGARIPWPYLSPGDSRRCPRCFRAAERHGYVDDFGQPLADRGVS